MNYRRIARLLGILLLVLAGCMATSIIWSVAYGESDTTIAMAISSGITALCGGGLWFFNRQATGTIFRSEGILLVALSWLLLGVFGGLPYLFDGVFTNPADAYFETVSGFTTTGSTVMTEIASHSRGIHWWRCLTHWLGGMGIVVLFVAIFPQLGVGGKFLFKSEVPGPITEGLKPKIKETAKTLWWIYVGFTVVLALLLLICGMTLHDALTHSFATMATGGFSTKNGSVGEFDSVPIDVIITIFMLFAGINFGLYYEVIRGRIKRVLRDRELWVYIGLVIVGALVIAWNLVTSSSLEHHESFWSALRYSAFQILAVVTTTGFGTDDFNVYPPLSKLLLVSLMFVGGMAGSTAGGMKIIRFMVLFKAIYYEIYKVFRPQSVRSLRIGGSVIPRQVHRGIAGFFALGVFTFVIASLYMAYLGLDIVTATTSVVATLFNIGPGLERVGGTENFAFIPTSGKLVLSFCMILGRLEFMTIMVLFLPDFWRR
jgi:trk system potassium uptake protein TrkH